MGVVVIGQIGRDLVLRTDRPPTAGESATVLRREELLGGKGANQAVGLAQLGVPVALIGVVGDDQAGTSILQQAQRDGIDVSKVARRGTTALLVDVVAAPPERMLLEDVPDSSLVRVADLDRSSSLFDTADTVSIQLQQPAATALEAAQRARQRDCGWWPTACPPRRFGPICWRRWTCCGPMPPKRRSSRAPKSPRWNRPSSWPTIC